MTQADAQWGTPALVAEVSRCLPEWLPGLDPARTTVRVVRDEVRVRSHLLVLEVGDGRGAGRRLFVKAPVRADMSMPTTRPRLQPLTPSIDRARHEFGALRALEEHIARIRHPSLSAIEAMGLTAGGTVLVMADFTGRPLSRDVVSLIGRRPSRPTIDRFASAGALLRAIHDLRVGDDHPVRQGSATEVVEAFDALGTYLSQATGRAELGAIASVGARSAGALSDPVPLVLTHGDYAPRNLLVDRNGRLAVIDLLGRWRAPAYEDIAAFLVALRTGRLNAAVGGLALARSIDRLEASFLEGYFGASPVSRNPIRIYELLLTLDKWAARVVRSGSASRSRQALETMIDRYFWRRARGLAASLRQTPD
jgi:aminoglycoside phosphotransferase (APT) family kinase protein